MFPAHVPVYFLGGDYGEISNMEVAEPGKLWAPVVIIGDPTTSFRAYEAIHSIVDGGYRLVFLYTNFGI